MTSHHLCGQRELVVFVGGSFFSLRICRWLQGFRVLNTVKKIKTAGDILGKAQGDRAGWAENRPCTLISCTKQIPQKSVWNKAAKTKGGLTSIFVDGQMSMNKKCMGQIVFVLQWGLLPTNSAKGALWKHLPLCSFMTAGALRNCAGVLVTNGTVTAISASVTSSATEERRDVSGYSLPPLLTIKISVP